MSSNEDTVLCKDLDNLCEVRDLVHSGRYLAVLVSSDSESRIFIIQVSGNWKLLFSWIFAIEILQMWGGGANSKKVNTHPKIPEIDLDFF